MALDAKGYFNCLKSYLNTKHYGVSCPIGELVLEEKLHTSTGHRKQTLKLNVEGDVILIKLDVKSPKGSTPPLFHFLDDEAKPWSRRCDFVIFNLRKNKIFVYCIEFKSETIPHDVSAQLDSSLAWCKALHAAIFAYTGKRNKFFVTKYVCSNSPTVQIYLDEDGKYLKRDHTVRHYLYHEIEKTNLADLENENIDTIR